MIPSGYVTGQKAWRANRNPIISKVLRKLRVRNEVTVTHP